MAGVIVAGVAIYIALVLKAEELLRLVI